MVQRRGIFSSGCALAVLSSIALAPSAVAQESDDTAEAGVKDDSIIVTATRKEERLRDIPLAVSALSSDQMETRSIQEAGDIVTTVPNMYGVKTNGLRGGTTFFIRGLGTTSAFSMQDPSTSLYVDEVLRPRQNNSNVSFADVERVEVLRGPQGTTFGRNSTGGAVSIVLTKPKPEFEASLEAGYGSRSEVLARGMINLPVTDKFYLRGSAFYNRADGWLENLETGEKFNGFEMGGARLAARFIPSDVVTWDLSGEYSFTKGGLLRSFFGNPDKTRTFGRIAGSTGDVFTDVQFNRGLRGDVFSYSAASNLGFEFDTVSVNIISGYNQYDQPLIYDGSGLSLSSTAVTPVQAYTVGELGGWNFTQEVKVVGSLLGDRLDYVAGLFYLHSKEDFILGSTRGAQFTCIQGAFGDGNIVCPNGQRGYLNLYRQIMTTDSYAAYAQFDYHITDTLTLTAGGRYTKEDRNIEAPAISRGGQPAGGIQTKDLIAYGVPTDIGVNRFTPRLVLKWQPSRTQTYYASFSEGFKSGSFNVREIPGISNVLLPEKTRAYEVGAKLGLFNGLIDLSADAFFQQTDNLQLSYSAPNFLVPGGAPLAQFKNAGDIEVKGLELEFQVRPTHDLTFFGSTAYQTGKYTRIDPSARSFVYNGTPVKGVDPDSVPIFLPKFSYTVGFSWDIPVAALNGHFTLGGDVRHQSSVWRLATNQLLPVKGFSPGFTTANFGIAFETDDERWRIRVDCKNCDNDRRITGISGTGYYYEDPRSIMATVRMKY